MTRYLHSFVAVVGTVVVVLACRVPLAYAVATQIVITDEQYIPQKITGHTGQKMHIDIYNKGSKTHNFVLPAFYIYTPNLPAHQSTYVEFTPDKTGTFTFYSDTGGAREKGLVGSVEVTE